MVAGLRVAGQLDITPAGGEGQPSHPQEASGSPHSCSERAAGETGKAQIPESRKVQHPVGGKPYC